MPISVESNYYGVRHVTEEKQTLKQVGHIISDETKMPARKV
jgi:hypothetical protein